MDFSTALRSNSKIEPRPKLYKIFDAASEKKTVYVEAPIGYGKTTAAFLWGKSSGKNIVSLSVSSYDDTPGMFFRRFLSSVASASNDGETMGKILALPDIDGNFLETASKLLLSVPASSWKDAAIVVDDCHLLHNDEIFQPLTFLIDALPATMPVFLIGRSGAAIFSRIPKKDEQFALIGADDLRFSPDEAALCFEAWGRYITDREARCLCEKTGGWPAAVALAAENGKTSLAADRYIEKAVWSNLTDEAKDFLTASCVAGKLNPELYSLLTGKSPEETMETLERAKDESAGLICRLDEGGVGVRYLCGKLFLDFLRARSEARQDVEKLYSIALGYHADRKDLRETAICAARVESDDWLTRATEKILRQTMHESACESVKIMAELEAAIPSGKFAELPYLHILSARRAHLAGDLPAMRRALDSLYESMPEIAERFPAFLGLAIDMNALDPQIPSHMLWTRRMHPNFLFKLREIADPAPVSSMNLPFFHKGEKDLSGCPGLPEDTFKLRKISSFIWNEAYETMELTLQAGLWYEKNQLAQAAERAAAARRSLSDKRIFSQGPPSEVLFYVYMISIAVLDAQERANDAARLREELKDGIEERGADFLMPNFMAYEAKLRMSNGNAKAAEAWLDNYVDGDRMELCGIFRHLTTARAFMILRETEKARSFLLRLIELAGDFGRVIDGAEAMTLLAILEWHKGDADEAAAILEKATASVRRYHFVRLFADEGASILPILSRLPDGRANGKQEKPADSVFVKAIQSAAFNCAKKRTGIVSSFPVPPPKLTKQQALMLQFLEEGCTRGEIADRTNLSQDTIKFHITKLYKKLDAHSAAEAVSKSRKMGLI